MVGRHGGWNGGQAEQTGQFQPKEGWGLTVIEANACGAPVVASRSPGLVESVRNGETGLLVPHGDVPAPAAGVIRLLRDRTERLRMAEAGRRWAATFDWETCYRESRGAFARAASRTTTS